jgi:hypothetical protein
MPNPINTILRLLSLRKPIVVVSGLPRSGTSMMMRMLESGGMSLVTDNIRQQDDDNPRGYYEVERIKDLSKEEDKSWLAEAQGKVIKVISFLLKDLPPDYDYKIIFMRRHLDEVLSSQAKMLDNRSTQDQTEDRKMTENYQKHLKDAEFFMKYRKNFDAISVQYDEIVNNPKPNAEKINEFLGGKLDVAAMAAAVEGSLYRNRTKSKASQ